MILRLISNLFKSRIPSSQRFWFWVLIGGLLSASLYLILVSLEDSIIFYYTPSEISQKHIHNGQRLRIGGIVKPNSLTTNAGRLSFLLTDEKEDLYVTYKGTLPSLFKEGKGAVIQGRFEKESFQAQQILAKHDENYTPPKVTIR